MRHKPRVTSFEIPGSADYNTATHTMSTTASENDVILNRVNLALAKSQRLIASWVPPKTAEELARTKTDEELEKEEQAIFTPVPDTYDTICDKILSV